jgi:type I restriction enzyme, S subunit
MKSSYKRIGDYIRLVDERNIGLQVTELLGLSISKQFIPSVANIVGADMENYKIIRKNQFACSTMQVRRDQKMPVALLQEIEEAIISQAYPVFEIKNEKELLPAYLMMWFERNEFDREASFHAVGGVRGSLEWVDFENMKLPIPPIEKQREIVNEYNTIQNRIALNQQLIQKLEETAQAIYREWFVEFEFPDENGKPYKSNGGEMVWDDQLCMVIPMGWGSISFTKAVKLGGGGTPSTSSAEYWNGNISFYTPGDLALQYYCISTEKHITKLGLQKCSSKLYPTNTVFVTARGATVGGVALAGIPMAMNQTCYAINGNGKNDFYIHQLTLYIMSQLKNEAVGATFEALVTKNFDSKFVISPNGEIDNLYSLKVNKLYQFMLLKMKENQKLTALKSLLLSKLSTV